MKIEPFRSDAGIVLLGSFNPGIYNPYWLADQGLIGRRVAEAAALAEAKPGTREQSHPIEIELIAPEIAQFKVGDFRFGITRDRLQIVLENPPFVLLQDMCTKLFGEILPHTPVKVAGINRSVHFAVDSEAKRNAIGRALAPTEPWGAWAEEWKDHEVPYRSGMASLSIREEFPGDKRRKVTATVQPSVIERRSDAIFVNVNDQYLLSDQSTGIAAAELMGEAFENSVQRADRIIDSVMALNETLHV